MLRHTIVCRMILQLKFVGRPTADMGILIAWVFHVAYFGNALV